MLLTRYNGTKKSNLKLNILFYLFIVICEMDFHRYYCLIKNNMNLF
jgi:hypothetical protein